MNDLDIEVVKENYINYKKKHYEDEREMRKLLKIKKMIPNIVNDEKWSKDYQKINNNLSDGLYYYNELKKMLSEDELKEFVDKVRFNVMKERYIKFNLDKYEENLSNRIEEIDNVFGEIFDNEQISEENEFVASSFANRILNENELIKKIEIICKYKKASLNVFFDITSILRAEIARLFINRMEIEDVDENKLVTACLVYAFKRTHTPKEIQRIKNEKDKDKEFLETLGFNEEFCKICSEYNRYNQDENYVREREGDILELVDKFVGLVMHREDRLAFPVDEALDLLETKILDGANNQYENKFIKFINELEEIQVLRDIGSITYLANSANKMKRQDITQMIKEMLKVRELLGGSVDESKIIKLEKMEKIQDKYFIIQFLHNLIFKLKEKIANFSKILKGYKKLSDGNDNKKEQEIFDR